MPSPTDAAAAAPEQPGRQPLESSIPRTLSTKLGDVTIAVNRLPPLRGMKAIAALGKLVGPALGAIIIQGVDLENGDHLSGGQLAGMLFDLAVRSRADADARARLEELIGGLLPKLGAALEALDVEQLEELVARFMVGASAVQVGDAGATPIVLIEQIDQVFPDAITLVGALRFAIKANLLPFIAKNTARSS